MEEQSATERVTLYKDILIKINPIFLSPSSFIIIQSSTRGNGHHDMFGTVLCNLTIRSTLSLKLLPGLNELAKLPF